MMRWNRLARYPIRRLWLRRLRLVLCLAALGMPAAAHAGAPEEEGESAGIEAGAPEKPLADDAFAALRSELQARYDAKMQVRATDEGRAALVEEMLQTAAEAAEGAHHTYAVLEVAKAYAAQLGRPDLALRAIDLQAESFAINRFQAIRDLLLEDVMIRRISGGRQAYAAVDGVIDEAVQAERMEDAQGLTQLLVNIAKRSGDRAMLRDAGERLVAVRQATRRIAEARAARQRLAKHPDDARAHEALGRYLCFYRGDWEEGLPHLAKAEDAKFKAVAQAELAAVDVPAEQLALADNWWTLSHRLPPPERRQAQERAGKWYRPLLDQFDDATRNRIRDRLDQLGPSGLPYRILIRFNDPEQVWTHLTCDDRKEFSFSPDGARLARTPSTALTTRYQFKGDVTYELEVHFGGAAYVNTGNSHLDAFGERIPVTRSAGANHLRISLHKRGHVLTAVVNGERTKRTIKEKNWYEPSPITFWWRSRTAHLTGLAVRAEEAFAPEDGE